MNTSLAPIKIEDREAIIDIFNYYVNNTFAAYPDKEVPYVFFEKLLDAVQDYPSATVRDESGEIIGFGMLRPYSPFSTFAQTAEITYFIKPNFIGHGIGETLLDHLICAGRKIGLNNILASISSLNEGSLQFHRKHGFVECAKFERIGKKHGKSFDVVYYQKHIE